MNVVYDISVLGRGYYVQRARTGVARVVYNLAAALLGLIPTQLHLSASNTLRDHLATRHFLASGAMPGTPRLMEPSSPAGRALLSALAAIYPQPSSPRFLQRIFELATVAPNHWFKNPSSVSLGTTSVYHSPFYPFPGQTNGVAGLSRFITIHDLIPILHPQYFQMREDHLIHRIIACIRPDDWVLTTSESTKRDIYNHTQIPPERIFVTHLAASKCFQPTEDATEIEAALQRLTIPPAPYILSVSTLEPRKNIERTIRCFLNLVQQQQITELNLVLAGPKGWDFERIFQTIATAPGLRERVIVTGFVSDRDLALLYGGAIMFVYPSYYEGFGLPPLEAMQCGTPVITSNTSSLPEIVGPAALMVDPTDDDALSAAMHQLYSDPEQRERLASAGLARANDFSWQRCAQLTLQAYRNARASQ